jgi:tetratricopeptide (TPR) repeat protein
MPHLLTDRRRSFEVGYCEIRHGDYKWAISDLTRAMELKPELVEAYLCRGNARAARSDFSGSIVDFNRAIKRKPDYAEAYLKGGLVRMDLGSTADGCVDLKHAASWVLW